MNIKHFYLKNSDIAMNCFYNLEHYSFPVKVIYTHV